MKGWGSALVVALAALVAAGCNDYGNTFQSNTGAVLAGLSPSNVPAGSPDLTITATTTGTFPTGTVVQWNGQKLKTTPDLASDGTTILDLKAVVPAALLKTPGLFNVNTLSPFSGAGNNGLSNSIAFMVNSAPNPVPTITSLSPSCAQTGSGALTITITGSNFLNSSSSQTSTVAWQPAGGFVTQLAATVSSGTQIQAMVPASLLVGAATVNVTASNPPSQPANFPGATGSGGGASAPATFTVQAATCPAGTTAKTAAAQATATAAVAEETPSLTTDGRFVAYTATQGDHAQVFLRDTCAGADSGCQPRTQLVSTAPDGTAANNDSRSPSISGDGRFVAFSSAATNLVEATPAGRQVFLRDTCQGAESTCKPSTQLISTDSSGALEGTESILPSISSSGRFVAFLAITPSQAAKPTTGQGSSASNADPNSGYRQVFVRDTCFGASNCTPKVTRISLTPGDGSAELKPAGPALSGNANQVASLGAGTSTLFTRSIAVDDRIFLAATR
jgi:hypothetical protein